MYGSVQATDHFTSGLIVWLVAAMGEGGKGGKGFNELFNSS